MKFTTIGTSEKIFKEFGWYADYVYQDTGTEGKPFIDLTPFKYSTFVGKDGVIAPAYDAEFLLSELPKGGGVIKTHERKKSKAYVAHGGANNAYAETSPEALGLLCLELKKAGVL